MDKDEHYTAAESCGVVSPKATRTKAKQEKTDTNLKQLTSAPEGPVVARRVATLAVQGGGDRGGGSRGDIVLRGAGGQMVVPMRIFEGWHRHVGSVIGILV